MNPGTRAHTPRQIVTAPNARRASAAALLLGAGWLAGCGSPAGPGGPDAGADLAAPPDLAAPTDLSGPPDLGNPDLLVQVSIPRYAVDGTVNALLHAGSAFYVGGSFTRISPYAAQNLIALDAGGAPTSCPVGVGFDGGISALATSGNSIYAVGSFTHYHGLSANRLAKIDATTCELDTTFSPSASNGFDGLPLALSVSGASLYVGGQFQKYRGVSANKIAKLDLESGALDTTFSPSASNGFDNNVFALVAAGSSLYVSGSFGAYRGVAGSATRLAKLDLGTGALDTTFSPPASNGFSDTPTALAASATSLYVGGYFTAYRGVANSAVRLAKLDLTTGALDTTFSPAGASSNGFNDVVFALLVSGNSLYAGGRFTAYRGTGSANLIARLDAVTGALDTAFSPPANNGFQGTGTPQVTALAVSGGALFVGGTLTGYRNVAGSANGLARLDAVTGAQDTTFLPPQGNTNGVSGSVSDTTTVTSAVMSGKTLWIGGRFTVYGGYSVNDLARLDDRSFAVDTTFSPPAANGFDGAVAALAATATSLYVGGSFTAYRGVVNSARRLAKLDLASGALDTTFGPPGAAANGFDAAVQALSIAGTSLYVGGSFTAYRGASASANALARLDLASGALDTTFSPPGAAANGFDAAVQALAVAGTSLYAGGKFTAYRGVAGSASRLARLDLGTGALDTAFSPAAANGFDGAALALAVGPGALYVGGAFTAYRGVADSAHRLAKLDPDSGALDTTFAPPGANANGFDGQVNALSLAGGALYAGGGFTAYRGVASSANRLCRLDPASGALDTGFSPAGATANGVDGAVNGVGLAGPFLVIGGGFSAYRGSNTLTRGLLLLDPVTGTLK